MSKVNIDVDICEKNISEIKNFDNSNNVDSNYENEIQKSGCSVKDKIDVYSLPFIEESNAPKQLNGLKENLNVEIQEKNEHLCNHQFGSIDISEIKNLETVCNDIDYKYERKIHNPVFPNNVQQYEDKIISSLLSSSNDSNVSNKFIEKKVNTVVESQVYIHQFESKYSNGMKSYKNICNAVIHHNENKVNNSVCSNNKVKITSSLLNTEGSNTPKELNNLFTNINDKLSSVNNNEKPIILCHTVDLKDELLNGINQYGIQDLMPLQQQFMFHCINGCDVIFHSYPCVGKSTMCLISVLQRVNTSLNECQAIILVPTLELAVSAQKVCSLLLGPCAMCSINIFK